MAGHKSGPIGVEFITARGEKIHIMCAGASIELTEGCLIIVEYALGNVLRRIIHTVVAPGQWVSAKYVYDP